jgi:hypothetical protein
MVVAPERPGAVRTALEVPRWAVGFYRRHLLLVVGISAIPAAQRFIAQRWAAQLPAVAGVAGELVTGAARLALVAVVVRLAILADERLRRLPADDAWRRVRRFARARWPSLAVQGLLLATAVLVFDVVPERVVARWVPADAEATYWAVLLGVKNLTVIPLTMIWWVGTVRQMLLHAPAEADRGMPA